MHCASRHVRSIASIAASAVLAGCVAPPLQPAATPPRQLVPPAAMRTEGVPALPTDPIDPTRQPLALAGCSTAPVEPLRFTKPVVLLGEVHDNVAQHALRLEAFQALLASGARPALAMEQFDRDKQPAIDRLLAQTPRPDADALIAAGRGASGWLWAQYRPFVALALQHGLPIVAANVGRDEARKIIREGLAATGFDAVVAPAVLQRQAEGIEASHCGMLDMPMAQRMAQAQVARDQFMAQVVQTHADRGVVLLAGNVHVRTDLGVPLWLPPAVRARTEAIGVLERGDTAKAYDRRVFTAVQERPDPCEAMRASRKPAK